MNNKKYDEARNEIIDILRKDLIGPVQENEIVENSRPDESYCLGILYPQGQINDENEETIFFQTKTDDKKENDNGDTELQEQGVKTENVQKQSSMGISFSLNEDIKEVQAHIKYAQYEQLKKEEQDGENSKINRPNWRRIPKSKDINISVEKNQTINIQEGLKLDIYRNKVYKDGSKTVTVTIVNTNVEENRQKLTSICKKSFFQIELELEINGEGEFIEKKINTNFITDPEMKNLNLLYRNQKNIAIGHGASAMWNYEDEQVKKIWIDSIPMYTAKQMIPYEEENKANHNYRRMYYLSISGKEEIYESLNKFINRYETWLKEQKAEHDFTDSEKQVLKTNIEKANIICERMRKTISLLKDDEEAFEAFQLMNLAMMNQMSKKQKKEKEECTWYPFQIAFILLSIDSIINPENENRNIVDLLWFPTGGGKTEAYLGIIAFTIFLRRIKEVKKGKSGAGVTAIMRYTLRLLTLQQFQRAAMLICACELIRRENVERLGTEEISIGLWVGELTKNKLEEQKKLITAFKQAEGKSKEKDPCLIKECPWCKNRIKPIQYDTTKVDRIQIKCGKCEIEGPLPIYLVDDEIYTHKPTLLLSTVDKYARIPWESEVRNLFSLGNDEVLPPELIVQDELHLIAGPLGTIDGLYEIILDEFFTKNNVKPKIIASTATIRNSESQVKALYNRECNIFPSQIKDIKNSFFAKEGTEQEKATRLYLGVISNNVTQSTLLIRIYSALFYAVKYIEQTGRYEKEIVDSFWTLVGYFNSIKELGGAVVQIRNDVVGRYLFLRENKFKTIIENEEEVMKRYFIRTEELTSRNADNTKIGEILKKLENCYDDEYEGGYDYILSTNMISVGIDIDRLNTMIINGQPKLNAEYIQASSRVGRKTPSIVITMYNSTKSRDISHYEQFIRYHSNIYKYVEATSVTPFSSMAREKALHSVIISLARHLIYEMNSNGGANLINKYQEEIEKFKNIIIQRAESIAPEDKEQVEKELNEIIEKWKEISQGLSYVKSEKRNMTKELLVNMDDDITETNGFKTLNSMRNVDVASNIYVEDIKK